MGGFIYSAVRRFDETILIDPGKSRQIGNQSDVGTFRGFNGAHASIMAIMNVTHLKPGTVTGQTARAQRRQTPFVGQFCQRVGLIHKLRQRRGSKEFFDCRHHRPDIDQRLGSNHVSILCLNGHSFANNPLHSGKTNSELILQQFSHRTDTTVAQMINVIGIAHVVAQIVNIVNGRKNIVFDNMFGDQAVHIGFNRLAQRLFALVLLQNLLEHNKTYFFVDTVFRAVKIHKIFDVNHAVGDHIKFLILH